MKRELEIRNRESYLAKDPKLNELVTIVEGGKDRKTVAVAKQAFDYFYYKNCESFKELKIFCAPYKLNKTKKYNKNGAVNFLTPSGAKSIVYGDYVVKIIEDIFIIVNEEVFHQLFSIEWKLMD
ncbi:TPA: hypothetical protein QFD67_002200 [Enterococcus faecium]